MKIERPDTSPQTFEGIPNCFIELRDISGLLPNSFREQPPVRIIYESDQPDGSDVSIRLDVHAVRSAISEAFAQYQQNIAPGTPEERFQSYLTDELGMPIDEAVRILRRDGISPFITLEQLFISHPHSALCFDFRCSGEEYLNEYGFSFDLVGGKVEFVTPRALMPEGSFPASRNIEEAEQAGTYDGG